MRTSTGRPSATYSKRASGQHLPLTVEIVETTIPSQQCAPSKMSSITATLTNFDSELAEDAAVGDAFDDLLNFFTAVTEHGDAVIIVYK